MLYTVLPGLTLCMSLLNRTNNDDPLVNVAVESNGFDKRFKYSTYLDAAMILIQAAKMKDMKNKKDNSREMLRCPIYAMDCEELLLKCNFNESGIYHVWPRSRVDTFGDNGFDVYCDMETDGGGWTVKDNSREMLRCPIYAMDCEDLLLKCNFNEFGIYHVWPRSRVDTFGDNGFDVYCDMETDGGGWTVFQRRDDFGTNSDFFYKSWLNYKFGFGHLNYDFWLGNDKIFALSNQRKSTLRIELIDFADEEGYAEYDSFYIDDESQEYRLHIGDYRGNIGDSFRGHNLCKFSTRDRDNDKSAAKYCARLYKGGWWYNDCHTANLNGLYLKGTHGSYANGINWYGWRGFKYSVKKTEMKLRSSTFQKYLRKKDAFLRQIIKD